MRKNIFKKALTLAVAGAMVLGMSTAAFADNGSLGNDGTNAETGVYEGNATSIELKTAVVITNNETTAASGKIINYPAMSFTHDITAATLPATPTTVTDENGVTVDVKSGITTAGAVSISETNISAGSVKLNTNGQEAVFAKTTITVDAEKFTAPGIYRYVITDTSTTGDNLNTLQTAGVVKGSEVDGEYFLDIYIKKNTDTEKLETAGYVLTSTNEDVIKKTEPQDGMDAKESGFDQVETETVTVTDETDPHNGETVEKLIPTTSTGSANPADLDKNYSYTTYNVTLTKAVKGAMGDQDHAFPFTVDVAASTGHTLLNYGYEITGSHVSSRNIEYTSNTTVNNASLDDGATLKIWGLTPFATVNYTETNDTSSTYKVKVGKASETANLQSETDVAAGQTKAAFTNTTGTGDETVTTATAKAVTTGYAIDTTASINDGVDATYFTNTLDQISPTGVALRFAPYSIMIGAALALVAFSRRRRENA